MKLGVRFSISILFIVSWVKAVIGENPCNFVDCGPGRLCETYRDEAHCIPHCDAGFCGRNEECEMFQYQCNADPCWPVPECSEIVENPCNLVDCGPGRSICETYQGEAHCIELCDLEVTGSTNDEINGLYNQDGTTNGKPSYNKEGGSMKIYWYPLNWHFGRAVDHYASAYAAQDVQTPGEVTSGWKEPVHGGWATSELTVASCDNSGGKLRNPFAPRNSSMKMERNAGKRSQATANRNFDGAAKEADESVQGFLWGAAGITLGVAFALIAVKVARKRSGFYTVASVSEP